MELIVVSIVMLILTFLGLGKVTIPNLFLYDHHLSLHVSQLSDYLMFQLLQSLGCKSSFTRE